MSINVYTFVNMSGTEDTFTTQDATEAKERAERYGLRVVENTYEWSDSETVWDFTGPDPQADGTPRTCGCGALHNVHIDND